MTITSEILTFKGFIQALPKSAAEENACVAIVTQDGAEYPILHKGAGVDLVDHISATVELRASMEAAPSLEGGKVLRVRSYTVTDGYEDPWYDDGD